MSNVVTFGQADLTSCDREPIHIPGSIQPFGALIAFDPTTFEIVQVAGNLEPYFGASARQLVGSKIPAQIGSAAILRLETKLAEFFSGSRPLLVFEAEWGGKAVEATLHLSDGLLVMEIEPRAPVNAGDVLALVQGMIGRLQSTATIDEMLNAMASQIQTVTGFDRVMVYRFAEDGSGHVIAEQRSHDSIESFLDLHYPASDIPQQARELYCRNWVRYIPDALYTAQPLWPVLSPRSGKPLDLSMSMLRSVSPIHLEYLANMGVRASMSLSLVVGGKLWGLIACHAYAPQNLNCRLRLGLEIFAQLASLHLRTTLELQESTERVLARDIHHRLSIAMTSSGLAEALIQANPNLLDVIRAAGVVVRVEGKNFPIGQTPTDEQIADLTNWLDTTQPSGVFHTSELQTLYPPAAKFVREGAGILALSVSREPQDYVIWFLPEESSTVKWAGDPAKPVVSGLHGDRLTPRKSFAAWSEITRGKSRTWRPAEIESANLLRTSILEIVLHQIDVVNKQRARAIEQQALLMSELDHRVKNMIGTIQSLVHASSRSADSLIAFTKGLEKRLHAMAKAHNLLAMSRWTSASVRSLIEEEISAHRSPENIRLDGPNYQLEPQTALSFSLVLHELVTNAVKYGSLSTSRGVLNISWAITARNSKDWLVLNWAESNGPRVNEPQRRGFGRTLIERVFAADVGGSVSLMFPDTGVTCVIEIPYERVMKEVAMPSQVSSPAAGVSTNTAVEKLLGVRVLLVEDNMMIAINLADELTDMGANIVGPFGEMDEALAGVKENDFDIALLDVNLHGTPSWPIADLLIERKIPFIFATGYSEAMKRPAHLADSPALSKPYDFGLLIDKVLQCLAQSRTKK